MRPRRTRFRPDRRGDMPNEVLGNADAETVVMETR